MGELSHQGCLVEEHPVEAVPGRLVRVGILVHDLDGDFAPGERVASQEYTAGGAMTQFAQERVFSDPIRYRTRCHSGEIPLSERNRVVAMRKAGFTAKFRESKKAGQGSARHPVYTTTGCIGSPAPI